MTSELLITEKERAALTETEQKLLESILETGDRAGYYLAYYAMTDLSDVSLHALA